MSKPLHSVLIIALTIVFVAPEALADGDAIVIQVRTDATPGVQFDSIRSELFTPDMSTLISTADHTADPARDYGPGVRVAEFVLGSGFDSGTYLGRTSLRFAGGVVREIPWRASFKHGHPHSYPTGFFGIDIFEIDPGNPTTRVITLLFAIDFVPVQQAFKVFTLEEDNDASSTVSPGDVLRYTIPIFASHALGRGSLLRDVPDPDATLMPETVTTSHGRVFRGNLPFDRDVEVRFGPVAIDETVSVSYLVRVAPEIINQGALTLKLAGSTTEYELLTDDPTTLEVDDPTIVKVSCAPQDELPKPPLEIPEVSPPVIPQFTTPGIIIESAGLGTSSGPPTLTINGFSVPTEVLPPEEQNDVVSANLTPEMTADAGVIPFTLTPADPQLPDVNGLIEIRAALETPQEIAKAFGNTVTDHIGHHLGEGIEAFQAARTRAHEDPGSCEALTRIDHRFGNEGDFGRPERFSESFAIDPVQVE